MSDLRDKPCQTWPADEESPDGLRGTPGERFAEAARRVFSVTKEQLAEAEAKQAKPARPRTAKARKA